MPMVSRAGITANMFTGRQWCGKAYIMVRHVCCDEAGLNKLSEGVYLLLRRL